jgi:hypothetical protein
MQPAIAAVDRPARSLVTAQQALLIQLGVRARAIKLVAAVKDRASELARFPAQTGYCLFERGADVHTFGNQRYRSRPNGVIERSHHDLRCIHSNGDAESVVERKLQN